MKKSNKSIDASETFNNTQIFKILEDAEVNVLKNINQKQLLIN